MKAGRTGLRGSVAVLTLGTLLALGVVGFSAGVWGITQGVARDKARSDLVIARMQQEAKEKADDFERKERALEQQWNASALRAAESRTQALARADAFERDLRTTRTDRDGLRERLKAYAAGPADPSQDTIEACRTRSRRLEERLDAGLSVQEQLGGYVARCAASVEFLLSSWPERGDE